METFRSGSTEFALKRGISANQCSQAEETAGGYTHRGTSTPAEARRTEAPLGRHRRPIPKAIWQVVEGFYAPDAPMEE